MNFWSVSPPAMDLLCPAAAQGRLKNQLTLLYSKQLDEKPPVRVAFLLSYSSTVVNTFGFRIYKNETSFLGFGQQQHSFAFYPP